jgi:NAD(P)H-dependent FMN reductase
MKPKLLVVVASTRPGRVGIHVAKWFFESASRHAGFEVELADLAEVNLPLFDEPKHPRFGQYEHAHTKAWSAIVKSADAFAFVTPEYNYCSPPSLLNALDYLFTEWAYKPVAFVSYGGMSGGIRSAQMTKLLVTTLKMMPIPDAVSVPMVMNFLKDGVFEANESLEKASKGTLDELLRWTNALKTMRG